MTWGQIGNSIAARRRPITDQAPWPQKKHDGKANGGNGPDKLGFPPSLGVCDWGPTHCLVFNVSGFL